MRQDFRFRALTYNVHLFGRSMAGISDIVDILSGLGVMDSLTFHDEERLEEIIWAIRAESPHPDVIGLTEVWDKRFADRVVHELRDLYPHAVHGSTLSPGDASIVFKLPDWDVLGAGLLLLSRHPFDEDPTFHPFSTEAGFDAWADKGVLAARINVPGAAATVGVLLTHLQADRHQADVRRLQLADLANVADSLRLSRTHMALIAMGDFNVIAEDHNGLQTDEYKYMVELLNLADTWRVQHPNDPGVTSAGGINDLIAKFGEDNGEQKRLDYILYASRPSFYVNCDPTSCELVKYQSMRGIGRDDVRDLSDHYGIVAEYRIDVRPFGAITYHIDAHPGMPDMEMLALRSLLAWMEDAAIGYARSDPSEEAPMIRVGYADAPLGMGRPAVERLGCVFLDPQPLLSRRGDPWSWGFGYDVQARRLDLAYALQHFTGRALHSLSPRSDSVAPTLDGRDAITGSIMTPYQPERQLADAKGESGSDHHAHLKRSDIDYMTALYGKRTVSLDWRAKVRALHSDTTIKDILESGLTGTNGSLGKEIVRIEEQIAETQAKIPIDADVYIYSLVWRGGITDPGPWQDEEIRFVLTASDGMGCRDRYYYPSKSGQHDIKSEEPTDIPVAFNPFRIERIDLDFELKLEVTELDSGFFGPNKSHIQYLRFADHGLEGIFDSIRSPGGRPFESLSRRVVCRGKWDAVVEVEFRAHGLELTLETLIRHQRVAAATLNRFDPSGAGFGRDLEAAMDYELSRVLGDST